MIFRSQILWLSLLIAGSMLISCTSDGSNEEVEQGSVSSSPKASGLLVADTIIYDVLICNPNPEDKWTNECLKNLKHKVLIDSLFQLAYSGDVLITDFFNATPLTSGDIAEIEQDPDFDRSKIGKLQFSERWYYDADNKLMHKEILSLVLGYELYNEEGAVRGYRPLFKLQLR